jgi:hypothetical protein
VALGHVCRGPTSDRRTVGVITTFRECEFVEHVYSPIRGRTGGLSSRLLGLALIVKPACCEMDDRHDMVR